MLKGGSSLNERERVKKGNTRNTKNTVILWFCLKGMFCPPSNISRQVLTAIARTAEAHTLVGLTFIKSMM